jgi:hypothetical protein
VRVSRRFGTPLAAVVLPAVLLAPPATGSVSAAVPVPASSALVALSSGCGRTDLLVHPPVRTWRPASGVTVTAWNGSDGRGHPVRLTVAEADVHHARLAAAAPPRYGDATPTTDLTGVVPTAVAGINGDYFSYDWSGAAVPDGPLVIGGRVLRLPAGAQSAVGSDARGRPFGAPTRVSGTVRLPARALPVASVNVGADLDRGGAVSAGRAVAVVTPWLGAARPFRQREVVVRRGVVVAAGRRLSFGARRAFGSGRAGRGDVLLAADGAAARALARVTRGSRVRVRYAARTDAGTLVVQAVGSGARMVHAGRVLPPCSGLGAQSRPRTLVAWNADRSRMFFLTVDGRGTRAPVSRYGASYRQVGEVARALGATEAVMLDGGGSTTMALRGADGRVRRVDARASTPQRPVPDALVLVPR